MPDRTGCRTSRARPGPAPRTPTARPASGTCTCSRPSSPTSTGTTPTCGASTRTSCGSGSTAASPASASTRPPCWSRTRRCPRCPSDPGPGEHPDTRTATSCTTIYRGWRARRRLATRARACSSARSGCPTSSGSPRTCARTSCTPRSTSTSWRGRGTPRRCASRSTRRSPRTPRSARRPPGCCPTTTSPGRSPATAGRTPSFAFAAKRFGTPDRPRARPPPRPRRGAARRRAARLALHLPGRRARACREVEDLPRRAAPGPDALPLRRRRPRARRLPRAAAVVAATEPPFGFSPDGATARALAAASPADWADLTVEAQARDPRLDAQPVPRGAAHPPRRARRSATDR